MDERLEIALPEGELENWIAKLGRRLEDLQVRFRDEG